MDGASQVRHVPALAVGVGTWLRDEEAVGSNPTTSTRRPQASPLAVSHPAVTPLAPP